MILSARTYEIYLQLSMLCCITLGPACALSCPAATVFRNYFINGTGQGIIYLHSFINTLQVFPMHYPTLYHLACMSKANIKLTSCMMSECYWIITTTNTGICKMVIACHVLSTRWQRSGTDWTLMRLYTINAIER